MEENEPWGIELSLDIHNCNPEKIRSAADIVAFTKALLKVIEMKAFGEPIVVNFGEDERIAGYSLVQLIETSLISGHFANQTNKAFINIFSCKKYDVDVAAEFACAFFEGVEANRTIAARR